MTSVLNGLLRGCQLGNSLEALLSLAAEPAPWFGGIRLLSRRTGLGSLNLLPSKRTSSSASTQISGSDSHTRAAWCPSGRIHAGPIACRTCHHESTLCRQSRTSKQSSGSIPNSCARWPPPRPCASRSPRTSRRTRAAPWRLTHGPQVPIMCPRCAHVRFGRIADLEIRPVLLVGRGGIEPPTVWLIAQSPRPRQRRAQLRERCGSLDLPSARSAKAT